MSQQKMNRNHTQEINAPFRAKSAGVSLVTILIIGLYYFANVFTLPAGDGVLPDGAISLTITTIILIIIVESALQIVLFIGAGKIEDHTERDNIISMMSTRNAHYILTAGVMLAFGSVLLGFSPFQISNILLLGFVLAEIVRYGSAVIYYQRLA